MRLVIGTATALCALVMTGCEATQAARPAPPPPEVEVLELAASEVRDTSEYLGSLLTRQSVTVVPQVAGFVRRVRVRPGQRVTAGQTLVEVDARQETAAVDSAKAQVASAQASLALAKQTLERSEALFSEGIVSAQERDAARAQTDAAQAALEAAQAQASQRQVQLQFFAVRAPFAGVVGEVPARVGAYVGAITPLMTLAQSDVLEVTVGVPAERARTLAPGTPVEILDGAGEVLVRTQVFFVAPEANPSTQLVEVKAVFENEVGLRPAELVRVRVVYATHDAVQIPVLAVVRQSGQAFAWGVKEEGGQTLVSRVPIALGALGATSYVVESGLETGARVAVSSIQALRDGLAIVPQPVAGPARAARKAAAPTEEAAPKARQN